MKDIENNTLQKDTSVREQVEQYLRYWYLFVLGVVIALACAYVHLRYADRVYGTMATIVIKDEKNGGGIPEELAG
ncbi:MAG: hypothetical protein ACPG7E_08985, partial [Marinirhabdus sp.]